VETILAILITTSQLSSRRYDDIQN